MRHPGRVPLLILVVSSILAGAPPARAQTGFEAVMQARIEELGSTGKLTLGEDDLAGTYLLAELYERRGFRPLWLSPERIEELLEIVSNIGVEGLDPEDYHIHELERRIEANAGLSSPGERVDLDLLLTDTLLRLGYHLRFGKVDPYDLDSNWNFRRDLEGRDPVAVIEAAAQSSSLSAFIERALPRNEIYVLLRDALARYRELERSGGWPNVPGGSALKLGAKNDRVAALRERLRSGGQATGDAPDGPRVFDEELRLAVVRFQQRHGLTADGVVGKQTLEALNVTATQRVEQIRVNLERARWVFESIVDDFLVVNIAAFETYLVRDGEVIWKTRSQVGKPYRKTPVFKAEMKYLVINPTWTVPPTILAKDVLPKIKKDRAYLQQKNMDVIDRNGKPVDPESLDWDSYGGRNFPYAIRQGPGPSNALGRVKFIFPNPHFVFLHDTPSKGLFERDERAFSSGCIRVEHPFALAELLLDDQPAWNREKIDRVLESEKTTTVFLTEPLDVMLLYLTAVPGGDGNMRFLRDLYGRDARILKGLDGDFAFRPPSGLPEWYPE